MATTGHSIQSEPHHFRVANSGYSMSQFTHDALVTNVCALYTLQHVAPIPNLASLQLTTCLC
jgi:hypothetical protein